MLLLIQRDFALEGSWNWLRAFATRMRHRTYGYIGMRAQGNLGYHSYQYPLTMISRRHTRISASESGDVANS